MKRREKNGDPRGPEEEKEQKERLNSGGYLAVTLIQGDGDIEKGLLALVKNHLH